MRAQLWDPILLTSTAGLGVVCFIVVTLSEFSGDGTLSSTFLLGLVGGAFWLRGILWLLQARYELLVDDYGIRRTGAAGVFVPWSGVTEVVRLPTRKPYLVIVTSYGLPKPKLARSGEQGLLETYGIEEGLVIRADPEVCRLLGQRLEQDPQLWRTVEESRILPRGR